jgi:hypothetical protein
MKYSSNMAKTPIKRDEYQNTVFILIFEEIWANDLKMSTAKIAYSKK